MLTRIIHIIILLLITVNTSLSIGNSNGIKFIENKNQWHSSIFYSADLTSGTVYLKNNSIQYFLFERSAISDMHLKTHTKEYFENGAERCEDETEISMHQYLVTFEGSNAHTTISGDQEFPEYYNYYIGNNEDQWGVGAKAFAHVKYKDLYDGVDMMLYSSGENLKYDFILTPGADISNVKMKYEGASDLYIYNRDLIIETGLGDMREVEPYAYQLVGGKRKEVECKYVLECDVLSFELSGDYDSSLPVVIDPLLIFSTYSGSNADNWGNTATPGENGKLYAGGIANHFRGVDSNGSPLFLGEFPATGSAFQTEWGGVWDVAITKYDSSGSQMEYATYLGGSGSEVPHSMIIDNEDNLVVMGSTNSTDFPFTDDAYQPNFKGGSSISTILGEQFVNGSDIFVAKLSKDGSMLLGSSYFGGNQNDGQNRASSPLTKNYGDQQRGEVFVDKDNDIYITSVTQSEELFDDASITSFNRNYNGGLSDGIVVKFDSDLEQVLWGGYIGGTNDDVTLAVKINDDGEVYVAGGTNSIDLKTTLGSLNENSLGQEDGYIVQISEDGSEIINATYLGTTSYDQAYFMDLDVDGNVYVLGQTRGDYLSTAGTFSNNGGGQFIHKLTSDLSTTIFSTTFGTSNRNEPNLSLTAFLVSECNNMYISGWGNGQPNFTGNNYVNLSTSGLPVTADAFETTTNGEDFYLMVLDNDATELLYATFFGGASALIHVDGGTSRFDKQGIVYHSVCASCDGTSSFPTSEGAWANENGSGTGCNNAAFKFDLASLRARLQTNTVDLDNPGVRAFCFPNHVVFENQSIGGEVFVWDFGDGTSESNVDATTPLIHGYETPGVYVVTLTAIDENTCIGVDEAKVVINVFENDFTVVDDMNICDGESPSLQAFGGTNYFWFNIDSTFTSSEQFPVISPIDTTKYYVRINDTNKNCEYLDSVVVNVVPVVNVDFEIEQSYDCIEASEILFINKSENAIDYTWEFGDGTSSNEMTPEHLYAGGIYKLTLRAENELCEDEKSVTINTEPIFAYNVITPELFDGSNDYFIVKSSLPVEVTILNRWGKNVFNSKDYQNNWNAKGEPSGIYYYSISIEGKQMCKGWIQVLK